ncbi:unnamed protein product [Clonostachys rosea]|uniref:Uncharacterized protein n=1 Tax=Bionectria ochroleuca TaxID=29856 RepID=A0ABY6UWW1_BIOOC|nr:unnamed protein product [Clonostachys rosea]
MVALKYLGVTAGLWLSVIGYALGSSVNEAEQLALRGNAHEQVLARDVDINVEKRGEQKEIDARDLYVRKNDPHYKPIYPPKPPPPPPPPPSPPPTNPRRTGPRPGPPPRLIRQRDLDYIDYLAARHYVDMRSGRSLYSRKNDPHYKPIYPPKPPPPPPPPSPPPTNPRRTGPRPGPPPRLIRQRDLDYLGYLRARGYENGLVAVYKELKNILARRVRILIYLRYLRLNG